MRFGPLDVNSAHGAILAHAVNVGKGRLKKGKVLDDSDIKTLFKSGVKEVIVARLEADDVAENSAAELIAAEFETDQIYVETAFTGRVNLFANQAGILQVDADLITRINQIDPGITIATLAQFSPVNKGRMIATVKIIPFAVNRLRVDEVISLVEGNNALQLHVFKPKRIGLIATSLPVLKPSTMDKTRNILAERLVASGSQIVEELRIEHKVDAVSSAILALKEKCDLLILFGASAITDIEDVIPSGLVQAGGRIEHFGMPVDPGNLLLLGAMDDLPIIGAPGCARSSRENGFDWILQRLLAEIAVSGKDIEGMGVGGLLMEIHSRPQPRQQTSARKGAIHALVLAAGQSRRMGPSNKLLAEINDKSLVRKVVETALESELSGVTVVTGHEAERVKGELQGLDVKFAHNEDFASGLASSLRCGVRALPQDCSATLVLLADMPHITSSMINEMIASFESADPSSIVQAASSGKRGNPVLWSAQYFDELCEISGDVGARHLIGKYSDQVIGVELGEAAALDIDTLAELFAQGGKHEGEV